MLRLLLLARAVEQPRAQDLQRLRLVLVLRLLVLAGDDEAGRQVRDAHGGVGGVDALPARARRAVDVDAQVLVRQIDLDVLGLGQHRDGDRRGVDAPLRLGRRHALHAVHAALELEPAEGALAPATSAITSLKPPMPVGLDDSTSTFQPCRSA